MRILLWQVHTGWADAFVRGSHTYLLAVGPDGGGGRGVRPWPQTVIDVPESELRDADIDVVVLQRLEDLDAVERLLGRVPGRDLPAIFVEHNTPQIDVPNSVHPLADRDDVLVIHVTYFNQLFWDCGRTRTVVIEHGIVDPGQLYTGELARAGVVINEPVRRWRVTGSDLLGRFSGVAPVDVFGMKAERLAAELQVHDDEVNALGDLPTDRLHAELARRRLYLHPARWTSLGLSLLEAMHLGMPVVAIASTEAFRAVPPEAGTVSTELSELERAVKRYIEDPELAAATGSAAREFALDHYGLERFIARWDEALEDWVERRQHSK